MAIHGIAVDVTAPYVSDLDPAKLLDGQPGATVFTLGTLDAFAYGYVTDVSFSFENEVAVLHPSRANLETVRHGLRGWRNMQDSKGADVPFAMQPSYTSGSKRDVVADDCLRMIPLDTIRELADEVRRMTDAPKASPVAAEPSLVPPAG